MPRFLFLGLLAMCGAALAADPAAARPPGRPSPRTDASAPLDFFRRLTLAEVERQRVNALIKQLDAVAYKDREKATTALLGEGPRALPLLRDALAGATLEKRMRLEKCIKALDSPARIEAVLAAVQLLREERPTGTCGVLLAYLPFAPEEAGDDLMDLLCRVAFRDGSLEPALVAALTDAHPARRAAAAVVVGAAGSAPQRQAVKRLLDDPDATVRFRAAQGLLASRDRAAVPVLLGLLRADRAIADRAESLLIALAGKDAPRQTLEDPAKCHAAWAAWWDRAGAGVDLESAEVGLTLVDGPQLARRVANDAINALVTDDLPLLLRSVEVPFNLACQQTFETREAFEKFYGAILKSNLSIGRDYKIRVLRVVTPAEHLNYTSNDRDRAYVNSLPRAGALVVHGAMTYNLNGGGDTTWHYSVVVRLSGSRARAIAFLELRAEK